MDDDYDDTFLTPRKIKEANLDLYQMEMRIISRIMRLVELNSNDDSMKNYSDFHQNSSLPTFLENSILNFFYGFKFMVFNKDYISTNYAENKEKMLATIVPRIFNDIKFYSSFNFTFDNNIQFQILSVFPLLSDKKYLQRSITNLNFRKEYNRQLRELRWPLIKLSETSLISFKLSYLLSNFLKILTFLSSFKLPKDNLINRSQMLSKSYKQ